jgi:carbamoyl-phosphate synthase large subunit
MGSTLSTTRGRYVTTFARRKLQMRGGNTDRAVTVDSEEPPRSVESSVSGSDTSDASTATCSYLDSPPVVVDLNPRRRWPLFSHMAGANLAAVFVAWRQGEIPPHALAPRAAVHASKLDLLGAISCRQPPT